METQTIRVWQIGSDGTEYYAAHSEEEMRDYYRRNSCADYCEEDLKHHFEEVADIDTEFDFNDDGVETKTTWRKLAEEREHDLPCQLSTGYN